MAEVEKVDPGRQRNYWFDQFMPESLDITDTGIRYFLGHYELTDSRIWVGKLCRKLLLLLLLFFVLFLSDIYLENLIAIAILWVFP